MMLRKSHSTTEFNTQQTAGNDGSGHIAAFSQHIDDIHKDISHFSGKFGDWLQEKRKVLDEDKSAYLKTIAEESELVEGLKRQHAQLITKRHNIVVALQEEDREFEEAKKSNKELILQKETIDKKLQELTQQIDSVKAQLNTKEQLLAMKQKTKEERMSRERKEIEQCESKLGLLVESLNDNETMFKFSLINPDDWYAQYCIIVDISKGDYMVRVCEPMIKGLSVLVDELKADGNLWLFLAKVRQGFVDGL